MGLEEIKLIVLSVVTLGLGCITAYQSNKGNEYTALWGWATAISLFMLWSYF